MLVEDAMILNRWKEYFSKLLNEENPRTIRQEPQRRTEEETPGIALEEVENALKKILNVERIPEQWRRSTNILIFKNKGDILAYGNFRCIKLMRHSMICNEQFAFMKGKSTTDAISALRQFKKSSLNVTKICMECS